MRIGTRAEWIANASKSLFLIIGALLLASCQENKDNSNTKPVDQTQGTIVFDVNYPELDQKGSVVQMLPGTLKLIFKDEKIKTVFTTVASIVEVNLISSGKTRSLVQVVKLFGDKYALVMDSTKTRVGQSLAGFRISDHSEDVDIANVKGKRVELLYPDASRNFSIITSGDFKINDPNWFTVYDEIGQMLLDYKMVRHGILMHLHAHEVVYEEIDSDEFILDEGVKMLDSASFDRMVTKNLDLLLSDI